MLQSNISPRLAGGEPAATRAGKTNRVALLVCAAIAAALFSFLGCEAEEGTPPDRECPTDPDYGVCHDGDPCTDDSCDPVTGCVNAPITCDDGNPCTDDSCTRQGCTNQKIPDCAEEQSG